MREKTGTGLQVGFKFPVGGIAFQLYSFQWFVLIQSRCFVVPTSYIIESEGSVPVILISISIY